MDLAESMIPWQAVTLHFPWNSKRRQRKNLLSKWIHESRKRCKLQLAYVGAVFQERRGKAHHAHLTLFGVNDSMGFGICEIDTAELEALWSEITGLKSFKSGQIDNKTDLQRWNRYVFDKNVKEAKDFESIYYNSKLLKKAGIKISKKGFTK
jgi:hypothetical protein